MKMIKKLVSRIFCSEENASKHINILTHYDDSTLVDKSGKLIKIIKLNGLDFVTKDEQTLDIYKIRRNNLLKSFSSEFAFYFWEIKRKVNTFPAGSFANDYAYEVNERYKNKISNDKMFHKELYLAVITKHPEGLLNKGYSWLQRFNLLLDKKAKQDYLAKRHKELNDATINILSSFLDYQCQLLSVYEKQGTKFSAPLEFLSLIYNFDVGRVPYAVADASTVLPRKRLFFNHRSGTIESRGADNSKKFAAIISLKAYSASTYQGMLDELNNLRCEYVITQSYRFYDKQIAKSRLRDQQKEMGQSKEESITQTEEIDEAFDDAASGEVGFGKHHFTLTCYADIQDELNKHVGEIVSKLADVDITSVRETLACELGFWAQFPGNFAYICREADISTRNMSSLASLHNYSVGKLTGNHWGDAVTVFETMSGSPYYFNFHYKDVGNFLIFGAMGSGKTVLAGFLILQSMKFGGKRIIFDKDRGLEIMVHIMGGTYEIIKPGIATGFNPCQLSDTAENRQFLAALFRKMLSVNGEVLTENDVDVIVNAIDGMYRLEVDSRQLCHIASLFGTKKIASLRSRFDQWHSEGAYAWVFDNEKDTLNLEDDVLGFDLGSILADKDCKTPALMYLTYRAEQAIEGQRGVLFIDEVWLALADDYFKSLIDNWSRTPRKKNNIFGLATQVANDKVMSGVSKSINESAFCKIFFPNPLADRNIYINEFGLTEREFYLVKNLPDDLHFFLLNYGRGIHKQSVVLRLNLKGMEDDIAVISARESSLAIFHKLYKEVSNDPEILLPLFHERRRAS